MVGSRVPACSVTIPRSEEVDYLCVPSRFRFGPLIISIDFAIVVSLISVQARDEESTFIFLLLVSGNGIVHSMLLELLFVEQRPSGCG